MPTPKKPTKPVTVGKPATPAKPRLGGQHGASPVDGDGRNMTELPADVRPEGEQRPDPTPAATAAAPATGTSSAPTGAASGSIGSRLSRALTAKAAWDRGGPPHLIVEARAGTGKTTTLIEGLRLLRGLPARITPSSQQQAVWDAMLLSKDRCKFVCFAAFNSSIAKELAGKVPADVDAKTMHGLGYKAVRKAFGDVKVNEDRLQEILYKLMGCDDPRQMRKDHGPTVQVVEKLVGLCKMNLVGHGAADGGVDWDRELEALCDHYNVELDGVKWDKVVDLVPACLERCKDVAADNAIDFNDQIWLPVVLDLPCFKFDLLCVDEFQDLNRCQQALAKKCGNRIIGIGDPKQAIYGFAGADAESMPRMAAELGADCPKCNKRREYLAEPGSKFNTNYWACGCGMGPIDGRGCVVLPLTVTRRCGRAIVKEANKIVPDFHAHESNPDGSVKSALYPTRRVRNHDGSYTYEQVPDDKTYIPHVKDGDMVLARGNAILVGQCLKFLKLGRKATIQGRDASQGLVNLVKKLARDDNTVTNLVARLDDWRAHEVAEENAKRTPSETRLEAINDRYECVMCFVKEQPTVAAVVAKIESVFTADPNVPGVKFSSIHRAKGLESHRVFLLVPDQCPIPHYCAKTAWEVAQEWNCLYIAITRAIHELTIVT